MMKKIRGAGGGKGGGSSSARVPSEAKDTLQSKAYAKVLDLLSEGPIEGLVDGLSSVYLDETPLRDPNTGINNFKDLQIDFRNGTQSQEYIPLFADTENEIPVGVELKYNIPVVRTITSSDIDAVRIRLSFPQMTEQNTSTGDIGGSRVRIKVELESNGGGYVEQFQDQIIGKSTSKYERQYKIALTGGAPYNIRITRMTPDAVTVAVQNKSWFESYTSIIESKLRYPNSAIVGVQIDSSQFSSIPTRAYDIKGLVVQVPSNYNPETREYDGTWDGSFQFAWTNNPAWIFYDLLTNTRYGLGNYISASQVDKWSLYTIGRYCDELVSDGFGGLEPRYTCNTYIQTRQEAFKLLQDLASCFNSMIYWANGEITVSQDAPADAAFLFTPANVVDGLFTYSGSSLKTRHSVALVTWNDPDDFYRQKVEYVEDAESIAQFGVVEAQVVAFGCTSRGQAHRFGKWLLYTERAQSEVVTFKTGLEASICRPGQIIKIQDPARAGARLGGRVQAATTTQITIDQTCTFQVDGSTLSIVKPDGTLETRNILSTSGQTITVSSAFSVAPQLNSIWIVELSNVVPQQFRILSVTEAGGGEHEITAIAHDPNKFDAIENDLNFEPAQISLLDVVPDAPIGLAINETLYEVNGEVRVKVTISWNSVPYATQYLVEYRRDDGNVVKLPATSSNEVEILNAEPGVYVATVTALNALGTRSPTSTVTRTVLGKALPPADVTGFSLIPSGGFAYLSWNKATDLDVLLGGSVRIRYSAQAGGTWKEAVDVAPGLAGSATRAQVPLLSGTYLAKFVDSSGNSSETAASIETTIPEFYNLNVVQTMTESPGFAGTKTGMFYSSEVLGLVIDGASMIDSIAELMDAWASFDYTGGVASSGEYTFQNKLDLSEVYTSRVIASIDVAAFDVADLIDLRTAYVDDWADLDGENIDTVNAELFLRTTDDDPASISAVWSEWKRFFVGEYSGRGFQFKVVATSTNLDHNIAIKSLAVTVDMPDRDEKFRNVTSGAGAYTVTYSKPFKAIPSVGITAYNMNSGDYWVISNQTRSGFDITFKNSGGTNVSRNFDVLARGYGRQLN